MDASRMPPVLGFFSFSLLHRLVGCPDPIYVPLIAGMVFTLGRGVFERVKGNKAHAPTWMMARVFFGGSILATYVYAKARDTGKLLPYIKPKPYSV